MLLTLLIYSLHLYYAEHISFCHLVFGNRLNSTTLRSFHDVSMLQCEAECRSRSACKAVNFRRHVGYCTLLYEDLNNTETLLEPKMLYSNKMNWQETTPSSLCQTACTNKEVCHVNSGQTNCMVEECGYFNATQCLSGGIYGNQHNFKSKLLCETGCNDILSNSMVYRNITGACNASGDWSIETVNCSQDVYSLINYEGCYGDSSARVLPDDATSSVQMSVLFCAQFCYTAGHVYFGVEFGGECFCGFTFNNIGASTLCTMACAGNPSEICGGPNAIDIYTYL